MSLAYYIYEPHISEADIMKKSLIKVDKDSNGVDRFSKDQSYGFPNFREDGSLHYITFNSGGNPSGIMQEFQAAIQHLQVPLKSFFHMIKMVLIFLIL